MNSNRVSESETGSPLVTAGTGSPGRLDPGRIRQPAGADGTEAVLGEIGGQSEQVVQHSFVGTPVAAVEREEEVEERVDEGTEADTEDAASSFIDVVGLDTPEKGGRVSLGKCPLLPLGLLLLGQAVLISWTLQHYQIVSYQIHQL